MGEVAEMMLDGTLCEGCGEFIGDGPGHPRYCSPECEGQRGEERLPSNEKSKSKTIQCTDCKKWFASRAALDQHFRDRHVAKTEGRK